jgi:FkbM family methyltransferase
LKSILKRVLALILGRQLSYRIGRSIYLEARGEIDNTIEKNGEELLQISMLSYLNNTSKKDCVFFDVGANIGHWTLSLLKNMSSYTPLQNYKIILFEPVPSTAATLRKNLAKNNFIFINELALSSSSGVADIFTTGANAGTNSLYDDKQLGEKDLIRINLTTADNYCEFENISHIDIFKSDAEGHDLDVIFGTRNLLTKEMISVLQFEYNWRWVFSGHFLRDVFIFIESLPYSFVKLQKNEFLLFNEWHPEMDKFFEGNYALINKNLLEYFPLKNAFFDKYNTLKIEKLKGYTCVI